MNKKFYFILVFVFAVSALLLGLSYSKDSGNDSNLKLIQNYDDFFRVVYSSKQVLNKDNKKIDFGISNVTDSNQDYEIRLIGNGDTTIYYRLDAEDEQTLNNEKIFTSSLTKKGTDGDYAMHTIEILNEDEFSVKVLITPLDNSLKSRVIESKQVFKDKNGDYRYYGANVDNYINLDGTTYRIIGLIGDKFRVVSEAFTTSKYVLESDYMNVEDYVLSFDKHDLEEGSTFGYESWLNIDYRFWLETDDGEESKMVDADVGVRTDAKTRKHYQRTVREFDGNAVVKAGDGSVSSPYEVSYGSK
jgi:hypothetical protein